MIIWYKPTKEILMISNEIEELPCGLIGLRILNRTKMRIWLVNYAGMGNYIDTAYDPNWMFVCE